MDGRYNPQRAGSYSYNYDDRYYHSEDEEDFADFEYASDPHFDPRSRRTPHSSFARELDHQTEEPEADGNKGKQKETMSSWIGRVSTSSQAQFAATALVSGAVVAGAIFGYQSLRRQERIKDLKSGIPDSEGWGGDKVGCCSSFAVS